MSNNQSKQQKKVAIAHAAKVLRAEIADLGQQIRAAQPGEEKDALVAQVRELMDSIGMEYTGEASIPETTFTNDDGQTETVTSVGATLLKNIERSTEELTAANAAHGSTEAPVEVKATLWQRFKGFCSDNKKKLIGGVLALIGIAGAAWYYVGNKNTTTAVSSVKAVTEATVETTVETAEPTQTDPSVFARIGAFFINLGVSIKDYAVAGYNWVKGLFTKTATETTVEAQPEVVPAAA